MIKSVDIKKALADKHVKDFFITECKSGSTWLTPTGDMKILDGLAIRKSWSHPCFTGYEVKVSRGDFLRDAKFYTYEELVNCLYIVCPNGMIERTELPESVGLMYYNPETKALTTRKKAIWRKIEYSPDMLLYIIYSRLDSDRIPFYSDKREYFEGYLADKYSCRMLGRDVKSKLIAENIKLKNQIENVASLENHYKTYEAIKNVLYKHCIWGRGEMLAEKLDEALTKKCPAEVTDIRKSLETAVMQLKRLEDEEREEAPNA